MLSILKHVKFGIADRNAHKAAGSEETNVGSSPTKDSRHGNGVVGCQTSTEK